MRLRISDVNSNMSVHHATDPLPKTHATCVAHQWLAHMLPGTHPTLGPPPHSPDGHTRRPGRQHVPGIALRWSGEGHAAFPGPLCWPHAKRGATVVQG